MKKSLFLFLGSALITVGGFAQGVIVVEGNYQGKNLYVQNPFAGSGVGFCVTEVTVNDQITTDEIASSAFEIDLRNFQLKQGDKVQVKIKHKEDCKPKVLNAEVLKPKSTYTVTAIKVDAEGTLTWTATGESGKLPYIIEQFRWQKWVKVGEVEGIGTSAANNYSFKVTLHSGENKFRLKQVDYTGQPRYSKEVKITSTKPEITFFPAKPSTEITFKGGETMYEIFDQYGNIVKKGYGEKIDVKSLPKGGYFLNYDNKTGEFIKGK